MRKHAALLFSLLAASMLLAGCTQQAATPTATPTGTPAPKVTATPIPTVSATPIPVKQCESATDCKLATSQIARYCNASDSNAWATETRFACAAGKCSDSDYSTNRRLLENCTYGCANGFCNPAAASPSPTPLPADASLALVNARITQLAANLSDVATGVLGEQVSLQGSPSAGYSYISSQRTYPAVSLTVARWAYQGYAPPSATGYNPFNVTFGNYSKEVDFLQEPGNCRQGLDTCRQKIRMQCYGFSVMATLESNENTYDRPPVPIAQRIAERFLASCPNEFKAP